MKHILITGADSYIGTSFAQYIQTEFPDFSQAYTVCGLAKHHRSPATLDSVWR